MANPLHQISASLQTILVLMLQFLMRIFADREHRHICWPLSTNLKLDKEQAGNASTTWVGSVRVSKRPPTVAPVRPKPGK